MAKQAPLEIDDRGFQAVLKQLEGHDRIDAAKDALNAAGKSVMKASMKNTPVLHGDVRDSHRLSIEVEGDLVHANIDVDDPAAWYVHEQLEKKHDDGKPKFLRDAIRSRRGFLQKKIREAFSALIRKKGLAE
jgi:hypothetical protein